MTTFRIEPRIDDFDLGNNDLPKTERKFLNPNFITSNSLFVQENENLEQRLASPFEKLNIDAPERSQSHPEWFDPQYETYINLGKIQQSQLKHPVVSEIPSNIIKQQTMMNPPSDDLDILRNLIQNLNTKSV